MFPVRVRIERGNHEWQIVNLIEAWLQRARVNTIKSLNDVLGSSDLNTHECSGTVFGPT